LHIVNLQTTNNKHWIGAVINSITAKNAAGMRAPIDSGTNNTLAQQECSGSGPSGLSTNFVESGGDIVGSFSKVQYCNKILTVTAQEIFYVLFTHCCTQQQKVHTPKNTWPAQVYHHRFTVTINKTTKITLFIFRPQRKLQSFNNASSKTKATESNSGLL
jgi:hypothetical protein